MGIFILIVNLLLDWSCNPLGDTKKRKALSECRSHGTLNQESGLCKHTKNRPKKSIDIRREREYNKTSLLHPKKIWCSTQDLMLMPPYNKLSPCAFGLAKGSAFALLSFLVLSLFAAIGSDSLEWPRSKILAMALLLPVRGLYNFCLKKFYKKNQTYFPRRSAYQRMEIRPPGRRLSLWDFYPATSLLYRRRRIFWISKYLFCVRNHRDNAF